MTASISKQLSANDLALTGSKQAGILVPKEAEILSFFPILDGSVKNPRITLLVRERADNTRWSFNFIYYNNKKFGGTRNEFRLTCMTAFLRAANAKIGDTLTFSKDEDESIFVSFERAKANTSLDDTGVLMLGGGWKVINA